MIALEELYKNLSGVHISSSKKIITINLQNDNYLQAVFTAIFYCSYSSSVPEQGNLFLSRTVIYLLHLFDIINKNIK